MPEFSNIQSGPANEKPLSGAARIALIFGAGSAILLFYLSAFVSILFLLALVTVELGLVLALIRFGMSGVMINVMRRHLSLVTLFFRSFTHRKRGDFRILLQPGDAPELFAILTRLCRQLKIAMPRVVSLEMSTNAWVHLKGFRRGSGKTILGIGYDLLAGLSQAEAEGVLAHEMVHAKLVHRGFKRWLSQGLQRVATLTRQLSGLVDAYHRARQSFQLAESFLHGADRLTRLAARLVASYSRQDEFEADRGAAQLCGTAPIRSSLLKLPALSAITGRLPWNERVARLQLPGGFSQWLTSELAAGNASSPVNDGIDLFNKYSTHPSLRDRVAALPQVREPDAMSSAPAILLLAEPDAVAEKLILEIQRVALKEEQKEAKQLDRWNRKTRRSANLRPLQAIAFFIAVAGLIIGLYGMFTDGFALGWITVMLVLMSLGVLLYRAGRYKDRVQLPVPDFSNLKEGWLGAKVTTDREAAQKQLESELGTLTAAAKKGRKTSVLAAEAYNALAKCDYLRAHVAGRLCVRGDAKSVEGRMALAIASAALGQGQQAANALNSLNKLTALATPSTAWGAAWTLLLSGDWARAEAFLEVARIHLPDEPTLLTLLAISQSRRAKLLSAIESARNACTPAPRNKEHAKVLINLLLDGGHLHEAHERLSPLETEAKDDGELMLSFIRLNLLQRNVEAADEWITLLKQKSTQAHTLVRLGHLHEVARENDKATAEYKQALQSAHFPEACLGLARLSAVGGNKEEARGHLLAALDFNRPVGEGGVAPLPLFQAIVGQFVALQEPALGCASWIARLPANATPAAVANTSFVVYAKALEEAEQHLSVILSAMQPGIPPLTPTSIHWRPAPNPQQPDGPVRPGVQAMFR